MAGMYGDDVYCTIMLTHGGSPVIGCIDVSIDSIVQRFLGLVILDLLQLCGILPSIKGGLRALFGRACHCGFQLLERRHGSVTLIHQLRTTMLQGVPFDLTVEILQSIAPLDVLAVRRVGDYQ